MVRDEFQTLTGRLPPPAECTFRLVVVVVVVAAAAAVVVDVDDDWPPEVAAVNDNAAVELTAAWLLDGS